MSNNVLTDHLPTDDHPTDDHDLDVAMLGNFCRRHGIVRLALFGSALRSGLRPDSDIDLLVEFAPGRRVSLFDVGGMSAELSDKLGRTVDLRTAQDLSPYFRDEVLRSARLLYAA